MKAVAQIAVAFAPAILAGAFPFMWIIRGGSVAKAFSVCWGLLIAWMFFFSLVIPSVAFQLIATWEERWPSIGFLKDLQLWQWYSSDGSMRGFSCCWPSLYDEWL